MNRVTRCILHILTFAVFFALAGHSAQAQYKDRVDVILNPGGRQYQVCLNFVVQNRHPRPIRIAEFKARIVSGRASFVPGTAASPNNWTVFLANDLRNIDWQSTTTSSEIDSGVSRPGFVICANDTGVVRLVWETWTADSLLSTDTVAIASTGRACDEAFFRPVSSDLYNGFDVDVVNGNLAGLPINDFHLKIITPGVHFTSTATTNPAGWSRGFGSADSIRWFTSTAAVDPQKFVEGFRFFVDAPRDSIFQVVYYSTNNGSVLCFDTATIAGRGLSTPDSVTMSFSSPDSSCQSLVLKNTHVPESAIGGFTLKLTTPGAHFVSSTGAPSGWTRTALNAARDSITFTKTGAAFNTGDTALFAPVCVDFTGATSDTIRYRWQTMSRGTPLEISSGTVSFTHYRALTACDSVSVKVDSSGNGTQRCINLTVRNNNSRGTPITSFLVRVSNPGTARQIVAASGNAGFQVASVASDSVLFTGGSLNGGESGVFNVCLTNSPTAKDPLAILWRTGGASGSICSDILHVNAVVQNLCDTAVARQSGGTDCCFNISFFNRNRGGKTIDGFQVQLLNPATIFTGATGSGTWNSTTTSFPATVIGFGGDSLAASDSTPPLNFCVDASQLGGRPAAIPVVWRSYSNGAVVCSDTLHLICNPNQGPCDTAFISSATHPDSLCVYNFRIANLHTPAGSVNGVLFHLAPGSGTIASGTTTGAASGWHAVQFGQDSLLFVGDSIRTNDTVGEFIVSLRGAEATTAQMDICTFNGATPLCCVSAALQCSASDVLISATPGSFQLEEAVPNPAATLADIRYTLNRSVVPALVIRDLTGKLVRRYQPGSQNAGPHRLQIDVSELPAGMYFYTLETGRESATRRLVILR